MSRPFLRSLVNLLHVVNVLIVKLVPFFYDSRKARLKIAPSSSTVLVPKTFQPGPLITLPSFPDPITPIPEDFYKPICGICEYTRNLLLSVIDIRTLFCDEFSWNILNRIMSLGNQTIEIKGFYLFIIISFPLFFSLSYVLRMRRHCSSNASSTVSSNSPTSSSNSDIEPQERFLDLRKTTLSSKQLESMMQEKPQKKLDSSSKPSSSSPFTSESTEKKKVTSTSSSRQEKRPMRK